MTILLEDIDRETCSKIARLIHATVMATPGTYSVPAVTMIVAEKSIWNSNAVHVILDDEIEAGNLYLDKFNKLYTRHYEMPHPRPRTGGASSAQDWTYNGPVESRF